MPETERPVFNQQTADRFLNMVAGLNKDELTQQRVQGLQEIAGKNEVAILDALYERLARSHGRGNVAGMRQDLAVAHFLGLDQARENDKLPDVRPELRKLMEEYLPEALPAGAHTPAEIPPWSIERGYHLFWEHLAYRLGHGNSIEKILGDTDLPEDQVRAFETALRSGDPTVSVEFRWSFVRAQLSDEGNDKLYEYWSGRYGDKHPAELTEEQKREFVEEVLPDFLRQYPRSEFEPEATAVAEPAQDVEEPTGGGPEPAAVHGEAAPAVEVPARILKINEALRQADSPTPSVEISSREFINHIGSLLFPGGLEFWADRSRWLGKEYSIYIYLGNGFNTSEVREFDAEYLLAPISNRYQYPQVYVLQAAGENNPSLKEELDEYMKNLPAHIAQNLEGQIEAGWEMTGMHVNRYNQLFFDFKKREPEAKAEPPAAGLQPDVAADAGSATNEPVRYVNSWQATFGIGSRIGSGFSSEAVYRPERFPGIVVKVYRDRAEFERERYALEKLKGAEHVARMVGYADFPELPYIVKEYIESPQLSVWIHTSFPLKPEKVAPIIAEEQRLGAAWTVSSMEAVDEIHQRGLIVGDYKFSDYPWSVKHRKTVLIDLASAWDMDPAARFYTESYIKGNDICDILKVFLAQTRPGFDVGMRLGMLEPSWPPDPEQGIYSQIIPSEAIRRIKNRIQEAGAVPSFLRLIQMIDEEYSVSSSSRQHSAKEYVQAMKEYFKEVGLMGITAPTEPADAPPDSVSPMREDEARERREVLVGVEVGEIRSNLEEFAGKAGVSADEMLTLWERAIKEEEV